MVTKGRSVIFKKHPTYNNYEVSDTGIVRSIAHAVRTKGSAFRISPGKELSAKTRDGGYREVTLYASGKKTHCRVNRLVLEAFVGPGIGMVGMHLDDNRGNNNLKNLRWGTCAENSTDMVAKGRSLAGARNPTHFNPQSIRKGSLNGAAKLNETDVERIRDVRRAGVSYAGLVAYFAVSKTQIARICTGQSWRA
jgi:hypothetical protein